MGCSTHCPPITQIGWRNEGARAPSLMEVGNKHVLLEEYCRHKHPRLEWVSDALDYRLIGWLLGGVCSVYGRCMYGSNGADSVRMKLLRDILNFVWMYVCRVHKVGLLKKERRWCQGGRYVVVVLDLFLFSSLGWFSLFFCLVFLLFFVLFFRMSLCPSVRKESVAPSMRHLFLMLCTGLLGILLSSANGRVVNGNGINLVEREWEWRAADRETEMRRIRCKLRTSTRLHTS